MARTINNTISSLFAIIIAMVLTTSCEHKELFYEAPSTQTIKVHFDWIGLTSNETKPSVLTFFFYNDKTGEMSVHKLSTEKDDAFIELETGIYNLICYSTDNSLITNKNTQSLESHEIQFALPNTEVPPVFGCNGTVRISSKEAQANGGQITINVFPTRLHRMFYINVKNTNSIPNVVEWTASLKGLTNSIYAFNLNCSENASETTITVPLITSVSLNESSNRFRSFGRLSNTSNQNTINKLIICAKLSDGSCKYFLFNASYAVQSAYNNHSVVIDLDIENATLLKRGDPDYPV